MLLHLCLQKSITLNWRTCYSSDKFTHQITAKKQNHLFFWTKDLTINKRLSHKRINVLVRLSRARSHTNTTPSISIFPRLLKLFWWNATKSWLLSVYIWWETSVTVLLQDQTSWPQRCVHCLLRFSVQENKLFKRDMNPHIKIHLPQFIIWDLMMNSRHVSRKNNFFPCMQLSSYKILCSVTHSGQALSTQVPAGWRQII